MEDRNYDGNLLPKNPSKMHLSCAYLIEFLRVGKRREDLDQNVTVLTVENLRQVPTPSYTLQCDSRTETS